MEFNDRDFIRGDNLSLFCNTNAHLLFGKPRGMVLEFPGLGGGSCLGGQLERKPYDGAYAQQLADAGLLLVYTFPGPWSWMNRGAVRYCDLVADAALEAFGMADDAPILASGGSMGGLGALIYAADSRHSVRACAAACPCYDALDSCLHGIPEFPRTYVAAAVCEDAPIAETLRRISPRFRIADMPDIPYFIVGDGRDEHFPIDGMTRYVEDLRASGREVTYRILPDCFHGGFTPEVREELTAFLIANGT